MNPLNNDELNSLLEQAKRESPEPSREMAERMVRAYEADIVGRISWQQYFLRPLSIPWPIAVLTAVLFAFIGALGDHSLNRPSVPEINHTSKVLSSRPTSILGFNDFQPVSELRPRVIGRSRDDQ
jgi:hypothetical protein